MGTRLLDSAESLSLSSTTSSTDADKVTLTADLVSGKTYALFWSFLASSDDTSSVLRARLNDVTGAANIGEIRWSSKDTTDLVAQGGVGAYAAASTGSRTFSIAYARQSGTGNPAISAARLVIFELGPNDGYVSSPANQNTTSATFINAATATWTATAADYLIVAAASVGNNNTEVQLLTPGGTAVNAQAHTMLLGTSYGGWAAQWVEAQSAGSKSAAIQYRAMTGGTSNLRGINIIAINLSDIHAAQTTQTASSSSGTETTYQTALALSATGLDPTRRGTLLLASAAVRNTDAGAANSSYVEVREDSAQLIEGVFENRGAATVNTTCFVFGKIVTANDASITFDIRRKSESTNTTNVTYSAVAVLDLYFEQAQPLSATLTGTASIRKSVQKRLSATLTMTATLLARVLFALALVAGMTMTASMRRQVHKGLSASVALSGSIIKAVTKGMSATCTLAGSIAKAFPVHLAASLTATASMVRTIHKFLSGALPMTGVLGRIKVVVVNISASLGMNATMRASTLFIRSLSASITLTASMTKTISKRLVATQSMIARPIWWVATLLAATRGDKPNWNQCARCSRKVRPNKLLQQMEYRGPRLVWTGLYVCSSCIDEPQPQGIWPRETGGDPKPVILARPRRD